MLIDSNRGAFSTAAFRGHCHARPLIDAVGVTPTIPLLAQILLLSRWTGGEGGGGGRGEGGGWPGPRSASIDVPEFISSASFRRAIGVIVIAGDKPRATMTRLHYRREPISRCSCFSIFPSINGADRPLSMPSASAPRRVTVHYFISRFVAPADRAR